MADKKNSIRRSASLRRGSSTGRTSLKMTDANSELGLKNNKYGDYGSKGGKKTQSAKKNKRKKSIFALANNKAKNKNSSESSRSSSYKREKASLPRQRTSFAELSGEREKSYGYLPSDKEDFGIGTAAQVNRESRKSKSKKAKRNSGDGAKKLAIGIFAIIIAYLSVVGYKFVTRASIPYDSVIYGSIDTPEKVTGIIIRDETVYRSPSAGSLSFSVTDLEKVKKGQVICYVKDTEAVGSMEQELEDINKSILQIQDTREDLSAFSEDIKRINNQIKVIVDENVFELSTGSIDKLYYIKENVGKKMDSKNQMLLSEKGGSLSELADKKAEHESEISKNTASLEAQEGGIVCYSFDGLEDSLKIDSLDSLTESQTLMKQDDNSVSQASGQVNKDDVLFKLIESNEWYIAAYIDNAMTDGWEEGDLKTIYIRNNGESVPVEAELYKFSRGDKKSYAVFAVTKDILDYIDERSITFEINKAKEGLKINNSAIVEAHNLKIPADFINEDGIVLKKSGDNTVEVAVTVSGSDDGGQYAYIPVEYGSLNAGDEIINPSDSSDVFKITDVSTSKGIYVINTGVTEFKKIDLENSVSNSTHTILDPTLNTNIKVYDRIVTDVKNIGKEEKIY